jgi:hypothetical protein
MNWLQYEVQSRIYDFTMGLAKVRVAVDDRSASKLFIAVLKELNAIADEDLVVNDD